GQPNSPPGQTSIGQEIALDLFAALRQPQPVNDDVGQIRRDDYPVNPMHRLIPLLLKHPREEPKPDDQANGVDDDSDVNAVPVRILAFFIGLCRFIHWSFPFRPKLQYATPIQPSNTIVVASFCLSEKTSRLRTERMTETAIRTRTKNHHGRESPLR